MATIGQHLTAPESGWRRYDDTDSRILYGAGFTKTTSTSLGLYNTTYTYNLTLNSSYKFKFYGTKFRLISYMSNNHSNNVEVLIDGTTYNYSEYSSSDIAQALVFEIQNLELKQHTIIVTNKQSSCYNVIDAIDIDDNGYLVHPTLNQVSYISTMEVGDCIPCRYTALTGGQIGYFSELGICTANEIPITGSSTPDGLFYLIKVGYNTCGKEKLIADRNIQTNISWDTLNTNGICSGECPASIMNLNCIVPILSNNVSDSVIVSASFESNGYEAWRAFDRNTSTMTGGTSSAASGVYNINFSEQKILCGYSFRDIDNSVSHIPKTWNFEASNDATHWTTVHSMTGFTNYVVNKPTYFSFVNNTPYKYYRFNITTNGAGGYLSITELGLYTSSIDINATNVAIRLLTGGVSNNDLDNEWNSIIVNSTLNGKITAGDDNIWNYSKGMSWTETTNISNSASRVARGSSVSGYGYPASSDSYCFRPVLLIDKVLLLKFLIQDGTLLKTIDSGNLTTVCNTTDDSSTIQSGFLNSGMDDLSKWSNALMTQIATKPPKIALYKEG